jgi:hypothetical protein
MIANALHRPLTAGSVDNAILRADGTGGTILQSSGLTVDDAIVAYSATGDAVTDVITATGHNFTSNQGLMFQSLTGGIGLNTTTVYFVRDISGSTFKVSATSGGAAINFTTNITAALIVAIQSNVAISQNTTETNSALVLTPKGTGAFILGPKPDGTITGGNARGTNAVDFQTGVRTAADQVASGGSSFISGGLRNKTTGAQSGIIGGQDNATTNNDTFIAGSLLSTAAASRASVLSSRTGNATGNFSCIVNGYDSSASAYAGFAKGPNAVADRFNMFAHGGPIFGAIGQCNQSSRFVLFGKTTTNSAVELLLDTAYAGTLRLTVASGRILACTINIAGVSSTGAAVAHYMRQYALKNVAGTCTEVYAPVTIGTDNAAGTSIALSASDANDSLVVSVTGTASTIWRWVASVDAVEITYGI